ncbi:MAG: hypothetical protein IIA66_05565 [Planctomycetes bacterium]|nr:hypothetical protein [Planctomycetota bacterium]
MNQRYDEAPTIEHDLSCMSCGYNLRALPPAGLCPECGTDIARSTQGDLLKFADRKWVGSVYRGTCLLTIADVILVVCILAAIVFPFILVTASNPNTSTFVGTAISMILMIIRVCSVVAFILMILGVWLVTKQEPRVSLTEQAASSRGIARAAVGLLLALYGLTFALSGLWHTAARLLLTVAFLAVLWSCLKHLEFIGRRLPAEDVVTRAQKRRRRIVRGAIALAIFVAARAATSSTAVSPPLHVTLLNLGAIISGIYLFFSTIAAIDSLGRFRPFLKDVLDDA